jgi:hypothetical protein
MSDSQKANIGIQTRTGTYASYNTGGGPAIQRSPVTQVQMAARTGLVTVAGHQVTEDVAATLQETAPELFEAPEAQAERTRNEATDLAKAEADRLDLNTHPDSDIEGAHMLFTHEVPEAEQIALLVQMHRDGAPSTSTLHRVAQAMGLSVDQAVDKLNGMSIGVQAQLKAFTNARGVDDVQFSEWMRSSRREESLKALTTHVMQRDLVGAWGKHIADFAARTGPKR